MTSEYLYSIQITLYLPDCLDDFFSNDQQARIGITFYFHLVCYHECTTRKKMRVMNDYLFNTKKSYKGLSHVKKGREKPTFFLHGCQFD